MTISSTANRWAYTGNGVTVLFAYTNKIFAKSDLLVYRETIADGTLTLLALNTNYDVTGVGVAGGGNVDLTALGAPTSDHRVIIVRQVPATQETDLQDDGPFPADTTEQALDKLTVLVQQVDDTIGRSLRQPDNDTAAIARLPRAADRASMYLGFDANGDPVAAAAPEGGNVVSAFMATVLSAANAAAARTALAAASAAGTAASGANADITSLAALQSVNGGQLAGFRNLLINGGFPINQRLAASNADDTYAHDRWNVLTQTGAIAVSTLTDVEDGLPYMARLTQSQATAQRFGYAQIVEGANCRHLRGKTVTFRFGRVRSSAAQTIRYAVLEWTGTVDAVTSDVVNDWTSASYAAGGFFLGANLTVSGVASQALAAGALADGEDLTVTLGSSFNNLIVMAWTEGTVAQNETLDLGLAQLEPGAVASAFEWRSTSIELALCQRYYFKTFPIGTAPAQNAGVTGAFRVTSNATSTFGGTIIFPVKMRAAPTLTTYNPSAANANWRDSNNSADRTFSAGNASDGSVQLTGASGVVNGLNDIHATCSVEL